MESREFVLIGYSGHSFVVADAIIANNDMIFGYCEVANKEMNPFGIKYLGVESNPEVIQLIKMKEIIIAIGSNELRQKISNSLNKDLRLGTIIHPRAVVSKTSKIGEGTVVFAGSIINSLSEIGKGVICNTGSIIEHEAKVGNYVHIAPGCVLTGNVTIGDRSFIGANAVIKQGVTIGKDVVIGAGSVVIKDVTDGEIVYGNPARLKIVK